MGSEVGCYEEKGRVVGKVDRCRRHSGGRDIGCDRGNRHNARNERCLALEERSILHHQLRKLPRPIVAWCFSIVLVKDGRDEGGPEGFAEAVEGEDVASCGGTEGVVADGYEARP